MENYVIRTISILRITSRNHLESRACCLSSPTETRIVVAWCAVLLSSLVFALHLQSRQTQPDEERGGGRRERGRPLLFLLPPFVHAPLDKDYGKAKFHVMYRCTYSGKRKLNPKSCRQQKFKERIIKRNKFKISLFNETFSLSHISPRRLYAPTHECSRFCVPCSLGTLLIHWREKTNTEKKKKPLFLRSKRPFSFVPKNGGADKKDTFLVYCHFVQVCKENILKMVGLGELENWGFSDLFPLLSSRLLVASERAKASPPPPPLGNKSALSWWQSVGRSSPLYIYLSHEAKWGHM